MNSADRIFFPDLYSRLITFFSSVSVPCSTCLQRTCEAVRAFLGIGYRTACYLRQSHLRVWFVQSVSIFRIVAMLVFVSLVTASDSRLLLTILYLSAMLSDLMDGYFARALQVASNFGRVLDLVADKSLTLVSLFYAVERGIEPLPLAIIATRDMLMIGMRLITLDGTQLLPTNRTFGGLMAFLVGTNTILLLHSEGGILAYVTISYWVIALTFAANLGYRFYTSWGRIRTVSSIELRSVNQRGFPRRCRCCGRHHEI